MKKLFFISLLMLFSFPVFAEPQFYDISAQEEYAHKLEKKFFEKYPNGNFGAKEYNKEVTIPLLKFIQEKQKTDKSGLKPLYH